MSQPFWLKGQGNKELNEPNVCPKHTHKDNYPSSAHQSSQLTIATHFPQPALIYSLGTQQMMRQLFAFRLWGALGDCMMSWVRVMDGLFNMPERSPIFVRVRVQAEDKGSILKHSRQYLIRSRDHALIAHCVSGHDEKYRALRLAYPRTDACKRMDATWQCVEFSGFLFLRVSEIASIGFLLWSRRERCSVVVCRLNIALNADV